MAELDIEKRRAPMWPWIFGIAIAVILIILLVATRNGTDDVASPYGAGPDFPDRERPLIYPGQPTEQEAREGEDEGISPELWRDDRPDEPGTGPEHRPQVPADPTLEGPRGGGPHDMGMDQFRDDEPDDGTRVEDEILFGPGEVGGRHPGPDVADEPAGQDRRDEEDDGDTDAGPGSWYEPVLDAPEPYATEAETRADHRIVDRQDLAHPVALATEEVAAVDGFARFVEAGEGYLPPEIEQTYAHEGIYHLAAAMAALAAQYPVAVIDADERREEIEEEADVLDDEARAEEHADAARSAFAATAEWLRRIQEEHFPELSGELDEVDEAALAISADESLLEQSERVDIFFVRMRNVLDRMQAEIENADSL